MLHSMIYPLPFLLLLFSDADQIVFVRTTRAFMLLFFSSYQHKFCFSCE